MDKVLAQHQLQRRIVLTTPYPLTLPTIIAASDIVAVVPSRIAYQFESQSAIAIFDLPLELQP